MVVLLVASSAESEALDGVKGDTADAVGGVRGSTDEADSEEETETVGGVRYEVGSVG
jgi:hypothetical protein